MKLLSRRILHSTRRRDFRATICLLFCRRVTLPLSLAMALLLMAPALWPKLGELFLRWAAPSATVDEADVLSRLREMDIANSNQLPEFSSKAADARSDDRCWEVAHWQFPRLSELVSQPVPKGASIDPELGLLCPIGGVDIWTGASNNFSAGGNWVDANTPPANGDSLIFGAAGAGGVLLNNDWTNTSFTVTGITFTGASAYVIGDGTTAANAGNSFTLAGGVTNNGVTLQTINNAFSLLGSQTFTTTSGGGNILLGGNLSGASGGINVTGGGTVILTGTNSYAGLTFIAGGSLQIGNGGTTGSLSTTSTIINNGTLVFNRSNAITQGTDFANGISGSGSVVQQGSGTLILTGANTYTGGTIVNSGTLQLGDGKNAASLAVGSVGTPGNTGTDGTAGFLLIDPSDGAAGGNGSAGGSANVILRANGELSIQANAVVSAGAGGPGGTGGTGGAAGTSIQDGATGGAGGMGETGGTVVTVSGAGRLFVSPNAAFTAGTGGGGGPVASAAMAVIVAQMVAEAPAAREEPEEPPSR